jgi:sulfur-oxidizing protein SoxB
MRAKPGERINSINVKGTPIDLQKNYTVAACEREGDPDALLCRIEDVTNPVPLNFTLHNIMHEYLQEFSPVSPKVEGRITATDIPHDVLTQLDGFDYEFR